MRRNRWLTTCALVGGLWPLACGGTSTDGDDEDGRTGSDEAGPAEDADGEDEVDSVEPVSGWLLEFDERFLGPDYITGLTAASDGGLVAVGVRERPSPGGKDAWLAGVDAAGRVLWQHLIANGESQEPKAVVADGDRGFLLVGMTDSDGFHESSDAWMARVDAEGHGVVQWAMDGGATEVATAVARLADGSFVVAGYRTTRDGEGRLVHWTWVAKMTTDGSLAWQRQFQGPGWPVSLTAAPDGNVMLAAEESGRAWLARVSPSGEVVWQKGVEFPVALNWIWIANSADDSLAVVAGAECGLFVAWIDPGSFEITATRYVGTYSRAGASALAFDGRLIIVGGDTAVGEPCEMWVLDVARNGDVVNGWVVEGDWSSPRGQGVALSTSGRVMALSGVVRGGWIAYSGPDGELPPSCPSMARLEATPEPVTAVVSDTTLAVQDMELVVESSLPLTVDSDADAMLRCSGP